MLLDILAILFSLVLLTAGAELLVRGGSALALRFGLSTFFVGLTIVGFGTSTPELATSIRAALNGMSEISLGNVVGSNIFNTAVILGLTAVIAPIPVDTRVVKREVLVMIAVSVVPFCVMLTGGLITRELGGAMVAGLVAFLVYGYRIGRTEQSDGQELLTAREDTPSARVAVSVAFIVAGLALLVVGSNLLVASSVSIARTAGVSDLAIGLTIVAAGTSMPELFTSAVAAIRGKSDLAIGNIVGSNIFNILGIAGITATVFPQTVSRELLWVHLPYMAALSVAALPIMMSGNRISRGEGTLLLLSYAAFVLILFRFVPQWFPG